MFVDSVVFKDRDNSTISLNDHCVALQHRYGIKIQKQSLDSRFDQSGVGLIKELLKLQLSTQLSASINNGALNTVLQKFSSVKIKDSTRFQIDESLREFYPGSNGGASGAGVHIQFEFDLLNGRVVDLDVTNALKQDNTDAIEKKTHINPGDLIIRDLGYSSTEVFEHIIEREAFFLNRLTPAINVYQDGATEKIDFPSIQRKMKRKGIRQMEMPVHVGPKRLPVRLIFQLLPEDLIQKKLTTAYRDARRDKRTLSEASKSRICFNLFITNASSEIIPIEYIQDFYRLRWQIELRFKAWKSFYHINKTKKMKKHRFECYLYATLLLIMINWEIAASILSLIWKTKRRIISIYKFFKTTSQNISALRAAIIEARQATNYVLTLLEISSERLLVEKRKNHCAPIEKILSKNIAQL
jgi:hypothetical protein